jgi:hypothetical protein
MLTVLSFMKMLNQPAGSDRVTFTKVNTVLFTFVRLLISDRPSLPSPCAIALTISEPTETHTGERKCLSLVSDRFTDLFVEDLLTADASLLAPIKHELLEWIALLYSVRRSCLSDRRLPDL